ncbi:DNA glycosylase AlkZ-like family protein [Oerskovia flava]|uniref:DNA glycosylase AlkZ-like family protein n=1 Tax=Oerskovia flava TaxID=2986422 RepID=UPI00224006C6|nr:crosslink repair DNA glycosylase YcaQ family protein [Oerskovia sp. JB1-3-2]
MDITWPQALAWRLRRQLLDPVGGDLAGKPVAGVVGRLCAVPAASDAELAIRTRRTSSTPGEVTRALAAGEILKVYAFRGATHLVTPEDGGAYLTLRAAGRMWERTSWRTFYDLEPGDWPRLRETVRAALADGPLTRAELGAAVGQDAGFAHLRDVFTDGSDTLLKPLTWQGDMSFGPTRDGQGTFQLLSTNPRWTPWPDLEVAGHHAVRSYVATYGPVSEAQAHYWLGEGLGAGRARIRRWWAELGDELAEVVVEGERLAVLREDAAALAATQPSTSVHLLPGFDQWVLGPGTADPHVVPPAHRQAVSRGANLVVAGGVVTGTWTAPRDEVVVSMFDAGTSPLESPLESRPEALGEALAAEVDRLGQILDRPLRLAVRTG